MGSSYAQNRLGDIYFEGTLVEKDNDKAISYFLDTIHNENASQRNKVYAMETLGDIFLEKNDPQAITWYEKVASYDSYAQLQLGEIYLNGTFGKKDIQKARQYFKDVIEKEDSSRNKARAEKLLKSIE